MGLNGFDIAVLVLVAGNAALGLKRGFVTEVLALFAWFATVFAIKLAHIPVTRALSPMVGTKSGAAVLAFVVLAGGTYIAGRLVANAAGARMRTSVLGPVDRAIGFGFGALKGLILASLGFLALVLVLDTLGGGPARRPAWIVDGRTYPLLKVTSASISDFVDRRRRGLPVWGSQSPAPDNTSAP